MYSRALGVAPFRKDPRVLSLSWAGAAYTLHSVEQLATAAGKPLLGHLSSRHRDCLQALIR